MVTRSRYGSSVDFARLCLVTLARDARVEHCREARKLMIEPIGNEPKLGQSWDSRDF